jgi:hypothetical protein
VSYRFEWISCPVLLGTVLVLLIVPHFALIALVAVALAAVVAVAALLAGAMLAMPYLLVRSLRRRRAERRWATEGSVPTASVNAWTGTAAPQSGVPALTNTTTARRST